MGILNGTINFAYLKIHFYARNLQTRIKSNDLRTRCELGLQLMPYDLAANEPSIPYRRPILPLTGCHLWI